MSGAGRAHPVPHAGDVVSCQTHGVPHGADDLSRGDNGNRLPHSVNAVSRGGHAVSGGAHVVSPLADGLSEEGYDLPGRAD